MWTGQRTGLRHHANSRRHQGLCCISLSPLCMNVLPAAGACMPRRSRNSETHGARLTRPVEGLNSEPEYSPSHSFYQRSNSHLRAAVGAENQAVGVGRQCAARARKYLPLQLQRQIWNPGRGKIYSKPWHCHAQRVAGCLVKTERFQTISEHCCRTTWAGCCCPTWARGARAIWAGCRCWRA